MSFTFRRDFPRYLQRAKPTLPEDMRRLIDEAVADGRITRIPTGVSGIPAPVWCPNAKVLVNPIPRHGHKREALMRGVRASIVTRIKSGYKTRDEVHALAAQGMTSTDIVDCTGLSYETVRRHLRAIGVEPKDSGENLAKNRAKKVAASLDRRAEAVRLHELGLTKNEIAERIGVSTNRVYSYLREASAGQGGEAAT